MDGNRSLSSKVALATVTKVRRLYSEAWGREWPHDDDYIRELWLESRAEVRNGKNKVPPPEVWQSCLMAMRENHPFGPVLATSTDPQPITDWMLK